MIDDGLVIEPGYRLDLRVANLVVGEVKAVESIVPVHRAQILSYLKLRRLPTWLLSNFNVPSMRDGIHRCANGL